MYPTKYCSLMAQLDPVKGHPHLCMCICRSYELSTGQRSGAVRHKALNRYLPVIPATRPAGIPVGTHKIPGAYYFFIVYLCFLDQKTAVSKTFHKPDTLHLNKRWVPGTKRPTTHR